MPYDHICLKCDRLDYHSQTGKIYSDKCSVCGGVLSVKYVYMSIEDKK